MKAKFSKAEQAKIGAALSVKPTPEGRARLLWYCGLFARVKPLLNSAYAIEQRRLNARARRIEKLAGRIMREFEDDSPVIAWLRSLAEPGVAALTKIDGIRLNGAPRKLAPPYGGTHLAAWFLMAERLRGRNRTEIPMSRRSPFADVIRIVYRVKDPLPIIAEINAESRRITGAQ
jgi:hypothetical protein